MNIARFEHRQRTGYGILQEDRIRVIDGSIYEDVMRQSDIYLDINEARLLAPVLPGKIVCVGLNYKDHAEELKMPIPEEPIIFLKPPTSVIGPGKDISYPDCVGRLDYEAELAVIIKDTAREVSEADASRHVLGYTCLNDVTARDLQKKDIQWTRAKSFDTFCPIGPFIAAGIDPDKLRVRTLVNGRVVQSSDTSNMIFSVAFLLSFISRIMTLLPGDIIATGTPRGVGPLNRGDEVEISIEGIGSLKNRVV